MAKGERVQLFASTFGPLVVVNDVEHVVNEIHVVMDDPRSLNNPLQS